MLLRLGLGCLLMVSACAVAFRIGDGPVRWAAGLIATCWTAATAAQILLHRQAEPVLAADAVVGLGMLRLGWLYHRWWLWVMISLQAALFFLHAGFYPPSAELAPAQVIGNNLLSTAGLVILLAAALTSRRAD